MQPVRMAGDGDVTARRPVLLENLGRCLICGGKLVWPSLYFDRAECVESWIAKAREKELVFPEAKR